MYFKTCRYSKWLKKEEEVKEKKRGMEEYSHNAK